MARVPARMTVKDLLECKGKRQLTMLFVDTPDEAAAAAAAGIDVLSIIDPALSKSACFMAICAPTMTISAPRTASSRSAATPAIALAVSTRSAGCPLRVFPSLAMLA
jgi:hypothetical protein